MKTFTRISSILALALAVCWGTSNAQETCGTAIAATCGGFWTGSTVGVTNDNGTSGATAAACAGLGTGGQHWYSYTPVANQTITVSTCSAGTDYDSRIHVFSGSCGALTCVGNDDDGCDAPGAASTFTFDAACGVSYLIRVGGFAANTGFYEFSMSCVDGSTAGCTDPTACNFSACALTDDGSCCTGSCFTINMTDGFGDGWNGGSFQLISLPGGEVAAEATLTGNVSLGSATFCLPVGCYIVNIVPGTFPEEIGWTLIGADEGTITGDGFSNGIVVSVQSTCIPGCTDNTASNFDPSATVDDGSCLYCTGGAQIFVLQMTDAFGNGWNGGQFFILDDADNILLSGGLENGAAGTFEDCLAPGCYTIQVTGGGDPESIGWTIEDLAGNALLNGTGGETYGFEWAGASGCAIEGCTTPTCNNYNPFATTDDGSCICPPDNDMCDNAIDIGCGITVDGTTVNANTEDGDLEDCNGIPISGNGVWYHFVGTGEQVTLSTCSSGGGDTKIHVFTGNCDTPVCVSANDDGCPTGLLSSVTFGTIAGFGYFVLVSEFTLNSGVAFTLEMSCTDCPGVPINDNCENALPLPDNVDFPGGLCCTSPDDISGCVAFQSGYGVWYVVNSEDYDTFDFVLVNGDETGADDNDGTNVAMVVYQAGATGCDDLTTIACCPLVTDICAGSLSEIGLPIVPNTDYYFLIYTSDAEGCGTFTFNTNLAYVGCTDPIACNYDAQNEIEDGSCDYSCGGPENDLCEGALTLDCNATIEGSTGGATATGAPTSCPVGSGDVGVWYTYIGDGQFVSISSCGSQIDSRITVVSSNTGCGGPYTCVASQDDNTLDCTFDEGTDDAYVSFVSQVGTVYYIYITAGGVDTNGDFADDLFDGSFVLETICAPVVEGCMDECACDYNAAANVDSGECDYFSCAGCAAGTTVYQLQMTDDFGDGWNGGTYTIEDLSGTVLYTGSINDADCNSVGGTGGGIVAGFDIVCLADGCYTLTSGGGTFPGEIGWTLVTEDGTVIATGGNDEVGFTLGAGVCGCTDVDACNYDAAATDDDGSCEYATCAGCTDPTACNFDEDATIEDLTQCCFSNCVTFNMTDGFGDGWEGGTATFVDGVTGNIVASTGLATGSTGSATLCLPDGCYTLIVGGGLNDAEIGWTLIGADGGVITGGANDPDGQTIGFGGLNCVPGCIEPVACNYDPTAAFGDCSLCDYSSCLGCTYEIADNYDPAAIIDDGSCEITSAGGCVYDFNDDNIVGVADLILFINAYGTTCVE